MVEAVATKWKVFLQCIHGKWENERWKNSLFPPPFFIPSGHEKNPVVFATMQKERENSFSSPPNFFSAHCEKERKREDAAK